MKVRKLPGYDVRRTLLSAVDLVLGFDLDFDLALDLTRPAPTPGLIANSA